MLGLQHFFNQRKLFKYNSLFHPFRTGWVTIYTSQLVKIPQLGMVVMKYTDQPRSNPQYSHVFYIN